MFSLPSHKPPTSITILDNNSVKTMSHDAIFCNLQCISGAAAIRCKWQEKLHRVTSPEVQGKRPKNLSIRIRATLLSGYPAYFTVFTGSYKRCYIRPYLAIIRKAITSFIIRGTRQILCARLIKSLATLLLLDLVSSTA